MKSSDKLWSAGEGNGNPLQFSCHENPMNSTKRKNDMTPEDEPPQVNMLLKKSQEIALEEMKRLSQSGNNSQLWVCLVVKVKSDALKNNIA